MSDLGSEYRNKPYVETVAEEETWSLYTCSCLSHAGSGRETILLKQWLER